MDDRQFCFSDWIIPAGFNRTQFFRSPLRDGTLVGISAVGKTVVRVEAARSP